MIASWAQTTGSGSDQIRRTSRGGGTPIYGIRPTGVGLPLVGASGGSIGAGDYAEPLKAYRDSGRYPDDLAAVDRRARHYLVRRLHALAAAKRRCLREARRDGTPTKRCPQPKPAITLDIDETAISNYRYFAATDFKDIGAGYSGWRRLIVDRRLQPMIPYKSGARAKLEKHGFKLIVNVGDQESDLAGGHADRAFKLPNPFYFTP